VRGCPKVAGVGGMRRMERLSPSFKLEPVTLFITPRGSNIIALKRELVQTDDSQTLDINPLKQILLGMLRLFS
jgi:hypothetical protein